MSRGFDTTANCENIAGMIAAANYDFVCRYYGHNLKKCITPNEARTLSANNVKIVVVWEDNPTFDGYFSYENGVNDGTSAYNYATNINQPANSAIYFAVDYDAANAAINGIIFDYFRGIQAGFAAMAAGAQIPYSIGVYGSGAVCSALLGANLANFTWLASARGWTGTQGFNQWNISQGTSATLFGVGVDLDQGKNSYGGF